MGKGGLNCGHAKRGNNPKVFWDHVIRSDETSPRGSRRSKKKCRRENGFVGEHQCVGQTRYQDRLWSIPWKKPRAFWKEIVVVICEQTSVFGRWTTGEYGVRAIYYYTIIYTLSTMKTHMYLS